MRRVTDFARRVQLPRLALITQVADEKAGADTLTFTVPKCIFDGTEEGRVERQRSAVYAFREEPSPTARPHAVHPALACCDKTSS